MSQAPGSLPSPPIFCIVNGKINYSTDLGANWTPTAAATVNTAAPISGDGSIGDPIAIPGLNAAGIQTAATSGSTPSVALVARKDVLQITVGADATQLTITGLSTDVDFHYVLHGDMVGGGAAVSLRPNGSSNATSFRGFYITTTVNPSGSSTGNIPLCDYTDAATVGGFIATVIGATGAHKTIETKMCVNQSSATYYETYVGQTLATTDITSLLLLGSIKAGSVISLQRMRATT